MNEEYDAPLGKSRSQKKRESSSAQDLGAALAALPMADLQALDLPAEILKAVLDWKKFPGHEAKRRQMQYIGRLMRDMDTDELRERLEARLAPSRAQTARLHGLEALRDALVDAEDADREKQIAALLEKHPALPAARVRHLARAAKDERAQKRPPKAYRELFRLLRDAAP